MRQRLSWSEEKVAEIMKQADPYTMNQDRKNPPIEKYETGDPSAWAEDQHKATPWKNEGRTETGHPAPAREAVVQARKLEDKALKCITIAQRMLPGALDEMIEDQATDLMFLPEKSILATLQRQSDLATKIAGEEKEDDEEGDEKDAAKKCVKEDEEATAAKKKEDETTAAKKKEDEEATAAKKCPKDMEEKDAAKAPKEEEMKEEEKDAAKAPKEEEVKEEEEKDAAKAPKEEEVKKEEKDAAKAPKEEEVKKEEVEAKKSSDKDLLDILFDNAEVAAATEAAAPKTGAKKLSGLVKQASSSDPLDNLWDTPPDVSSVFK